jgi:hypothetical protein
MACSLTVPPCLCKVCCFSADIKHKSHPSSCYKGDSLPDHACSSTHCVKLDFTTETIGSTSSLLSTFDGLFLIQFILHIKCPAAPLSALGWILAHIFLCLSIRHRGSWWSDPPHRVGPEHHRVEACVWNPSSLVRLRLGC